MGSVAAVCCAQSAASGGTSAGATSQAEVRFQFERMGLAVPKFTMIVHEDGTGSYKGEIAPISGGTNGAMLQPASPGQTIDRKIKLGAATTETIFKTARSLDNFNIECASKAKNIADTGKKTLSYSGQDGHGSCSYNYSENKAITQLTEMFQAIAFTMDEGRKLDFMHRFDRLGLYSEMDSLKHEVQEKRALELQNIAPSLTSIANDEALMQRVRERAVMLLNQSGESK
ncbi:MAG: hypothetical protein JSS95_04785 [Acidobacteria bacterium]|nr:hypothetical protein [Acidobacteriota bacterium]